MLALLTSGRLDEAHRAALEVQEMNRTIQAPGESALTSASLLAIATLRGDLAAAERHGRDALDRHRLATVLIDLLTEEEEARLERLIAAETQPEKPA